MITFLSQSEYDQSCLDNVSRLVYDEACSVLSDGNVCDCSEEILEYLQYLAGRLSLSTKVIDGYLSIVSSANSDLLDIDDLGKITPLGFNQGNDPRFVTRG